MKILSAFTHPHAIAHVFLFHAITINGSIPNFQWMHSIQNHYKNVTKLKY